MKTRRIACGFAAIVSLMIGGLMMFTGCPTDQAPVTPGATGYTLTYAANPAGGTLAAAVGGTAVASGAKVAANAQVTLTATPANSYVFKNFTVAGTSHNGSPSGTSGVHTYQFAMTADTAVAAAFEALGEGDHVVLYVANPAAGGEFGGDRPVQAKENDTVSFTVTANSGYAIESVSWKTTAGGTAETLTADNGTYSFTMPDAAVTVTADFASTTGPTTYTVTVSSAGTGSSGGGSYEHNATVSISAGTAPAGQQFKNWTTDSDGVDFADANSSSTTFPMPANDVTVTAVFEPASGPEPTVLFTWSKENSSLTDSPVTANTPYNSGYKGIYFGARANAITVEDGAFKLGTGISTGTAYSVLMIGSGSATGSTTPYEAQTNSTTHVPGQFDLSAGTFRLTVNYVEPPVYTDGGVTGGIGNGFVGAHR